MTTEEPDVVLGMVGPLVTTQDRQRHTHTREDIAVFQTSSKFIVAFLTSRV